MRNLDLNLLLMFDILYQERSVTKAARRLNLTQSAVSHSLRRLRLALNDELFIRGANGLEPTSRANSLADKLAPALGQIRDAVAYSEFDPADSARCFTIVACSLYLEQQAPHLVERVREFAPHVSLHFVRTASFGDMLSEGSSFDVAVDVVDDIPAGLCGTRLAKEPLLWVAGAASPLVGQRVTADMLTSQPSVQFEVQEGWHRGQNVDDPLFDGTIFESDIRRLWLSRGGGDAANLYVAEASLAAHLMAGTDYVGRLPKSLAERYAASSDLALLDIDFSAGDETLSLVWPRHLDSDQGRIWLTELMHSSYR